MAFNHEIPEDALTRDQMLDDISLYWFTGTGASSARLYGEGVGNTIRENGFFASSRASSAPIDLPMGATIFPGETFLAPRSWPEAAWPNLFYWNEVDKGGHFPASSSRKSSQKKSGKPSERFAAKLMAARDLRWANDYPPIAIACI